MAWIRRAGEGTQVGGKAVRVMTKQYHCIRPRGKAWSTQRAAYVTPNLVDYTRRRGPQCGAKQRRWSIG